jgi:hypothetical protein
LTYLSERNNSVLRAAMLLLAAVFVMLFAAARADAATYTVDTSADNGALNTCGAGAGDCSLRGAIDKANDDTTTDSIDFAGSVTSVTLNAPMDPITEKLVVNGGGTTVVGSGAYATACLPSKYAFDVTTAQVALFALPIYDVCARPIKSNVTAPSIQVGPRKANDTVSLNGTGAGDSVDAFRADSPADANEALSYLESAVTPGGNFSILLNTLPSLTDKFTAAGTSGGTTSPFAAAVTRPADLTSPILINAVANANNSVRLDFNESISGNINAAPGAFTLKMGTANRQITSVGAFGNSVYLGSVSTPWSTGEAGTVTLNGAGRVTDLTGNEVIGNPAKTVFSGPGELTVPVVSKFKASPSKFCQKKTSKCRRGQTYLYITLSKPSRVVFNVYRAKGRKFVVRYVRKLPAGTSKTRLFGTINGRTLPATSLLVNAVAEDPARNLSVPVDAPFKVVTRKSQL